VILVSETGATELVKLPKNDESKHVIQMAIAKALRDLC
jgi:hypothetical protein